MGIHRNSISVSRNSFSGRRTSEYYRYLDAQLSTPQSNVLYRSESPMTSISGYRKVKSTGRNLTSPCFSILSPGGFLTKERRLWRFSGFPFRDNLLNWEGHSLL